MGQVRCEIIAIGNELLLGEVLDTNTNWLCRHLTGLGGKVVRCFMVGDDPEEIGWAIKSSLSRGTELIFTTGGLGPTADDITLQSIAQALDLPLEENQEALKMIESRYMALYQAGYVREPAVTPPRRKMALFPKGGKPLFNPVGTAPGMLLECQGSYIVSLPGVPEEMKGIFRSSLAPFLEKIFGQSSYESITLAVECGDESSIAEVLEKVAKLCPNVYVKSRARAFGKEVRLKITLASSGSDPQKVSEAIEGARSLLEKELASRGIKLSEER